MDTTRKSPLDEMLMWDTLGLEMNCGVPILQALNILRDSFPLYETEIQAMHDGIKEGDSMAMSMQKYAAAFHPMMITLVDVGEETGALPDTLMRGSELIKKEIDLYSRGRRPGSDQALGKTMFYYTNSVMLDAGLPLLRNLRILGKMTSETYPSREIIKDMGASIEGGSTFSEAIAQHPDYFNKMDINMIRAGEAGGVLEIVMGRMADYLERRYLSEQLYRP